MSLPPHVASTVVWTRPTLAGTVAAFLVGNLFANFVLLAALFWGLFRVLSVPPSLLLAIAALYYAHVFLSRAPVTGWAATGLVDTFRRTVSDGGPFTQYFDFRVLMDDPAASTSIEPGRSYIFGYSPHGIHGFGTFLFFDRTSPFYGTHPFLRNRMVGLGAGVLFYVPLVREFFLALGWRDASRAVCERALAEGNSLYIIVGGEAEALLSAPGTDDVVLAGRKRRGFVRLALESGAQLVPCYCFHNTDTYATNTGLLYGLRKWLSHAHRVCIPFFWGRFFTPLPFNVQLTVAIGNPVPWPAGYDDAAAEKRMAALRDKGEKWRAPEEMVEGYQVAYQEALKDLFERHKAAAGYPPERVLRILES
ncbi:diacylglycerol acyltransferase-domain-containing protein [Hyaloraphidium curvatum]|nr:diacylglycerol acyltransferase-domain-containing protein [Hyaloraphidium curvatum]